MSARRLAPVALLLALACVTSGCALSTMTPLQPLDRGESAVSAVADFPGIYISPRMVGQYTYGLGGGDVSGRLGATAVSAEVGATGRWYTTDWLHLELQGDYRLEFEADPDYQVWLTPRAIAYESSGAVHTYAGWDAAFSYASENVDSTRFEIASGPIFGLEVPIDGVGALQFETTLRPFFFNGQDGLTVGRSLHGEFEGSTLWLLPQMSVGFHFR